MQSGLGSPLTLTLSPREREQAEKTLLWSLVREFVPTPTDVLPLPAGEGRGEGEADSQLNGHGRPIGTT